jgi:HSP20 family protein
MVSTWRWTGSAGPFGEIQVLVNDLVEQLFGETEVVWPAAEVRRTETGYLIVVAVPGVAREDLSLTVDGATVTLEGLRRPQEPPAGAEQLTRERLVGTFRRVLVLPEAVDGEQVRARLVDGLLQVELPRPESAQAREIPIDPEVSS